MYFGINGFLIRFAFSLQGLALGLVLSVSGYVQPATPTDVPAQPAAALWGMRILIAGLPMLAMGSLGDLATAARRKADGAEARLPKPHYPRVRLLSAPTGCARSDRRPEGVPAGPARMLRALHCQPGGSSPVCLRSVAAARR
jgi:hypothetical protein